MYSVRIFMRKDFILLIIYLIGEFNSYERITDDYSVKMSFTAKEGLKHAII